MWRRKPEPEPDHVSESSWYREQRLERARQQRLGIAYYHLDHHPMLLALDDTPLLLADLHHRLQKLEG